MSHACYCHVLRKATRRLTALYDETLAPIGISLAQYSVIRKIGAAGTISLTELGRVLELDRSTVGRNVRTLEKLGLIGPGQSEDQRETAVCLTSVGETTLAEAVVLWTELQGRIDEAYGIERMQALLAGLEAL